jgi:hypothetical protein
MTVPTNTVQTFARSDIREDLKDLVFNVDPIQTPILNRSKRAKAEARKHEWDCDVIPAQAPSNLQIEGDDATADSQNDVARLNNVCCISRKTVALSGTLQAVRAAGGTNHFGYQLVRNIKALKRDVEYNLSANRARSTGNSSTATICGGLPAYLTRNIVLGSGGTAPSGVVTIGGQNFGDGSTTVTQGTKTNLAETNVDSLNQLVYTGCGKSIETLLVSATNKQAISKFTGPGSTTRFVRADDGSNNTLSVAIDYFDHDFGKFEVMPDLFLADSAVCFGIRWEYLAVAFLRQFDTEPLAKTGDSDRKLVIVEYTPEIRNEHALGAIYATNG